MADNESDLETDGLELALDSLCLRHCMDESSLNSKDYCSDFCELVQEYTGQWHVPLPQLKVLRTALCNFTKATAAFPDDCQHVQYVLSSLALSFFELMLFFSKEEFLEEPLKNILDCFQECHSKLLRHRNIYLHHVKQVIKGGGPWENPALQRILKEAEMSQSEVDDYLRTELPIFLELRVRYLQACERIQEAMALCKSCLENQETGKHLYFHQAYLTCLYKASLYESLQKEMAEIDGRDAVEIICNTESVEKDELLLSLCKAFLTRQLHEGDMYYIWDLVFIWSRLHLRASPSRQGFLAECLELASSATNVRAIFPFIKLLTELGGKGVEVAVELCARALQLCDMQGDTVTRSLVCKTIAFLLPHDLEICRACSLLVFCQERSLEAYRTVCLLYRHPDQEQHPHNNPLRTNVRFVIMQMLKERLCFDPEFWNLLTLRTRCLELMSDNVVKDAVLSEMKEEEEKEYREGLLPNNCVNESCAPSLDSCLRTQAAVESKDLPENLVVVAPETKCLAQSRVHLRRRKWRKPLAKLDFVDDPEFKYNLKPHSLSSKPMYSLRNNHIKVGYTGPVRLPSNHSGEYFPQGVKNQIFKRRGRKKRWLQGLPNVEQAQPVSAKKFKVGGEKRGRKPLPRLELSFPENEIPVTEEACGVEVDAEGKEQALPDLDFEPQSIGKQTEDEVELLNEPNKENSADASVVAGYRLGEQSEEAPLVSKLCDDLPSEPQGAVPVQANPEVDGPVIELLVNPVELLHNYSLLPRTSDGDEPKSPESKTSEEVNGNIKQESKSEVETEDQEVKPKPIKTWRERSLRTQQYGHLSFTCKICHKTFKGLNVMRHAFSHLKKRRLRCILCGKHFKNLPLAKKHILDHINEMSNHKPNEEQTQESPPANGVMENEHRSEEENLPSVTENKPKKKPKSKNKLLNLKREERIIRNIRILLKKTALIHKKSKNPSVDIINMVEFSDEQVVIADGLVIIKNASLKKTEEEATETPVEENGCSVDSTYPLCPSEVCDRVFLKMNSSLTRHAIKCHLGEEKVLEKTYVWSKHKCYFCVRHINYLEQYKQHMKLHNDPLPFFCYHTECKLRFATQPELKEHINTHQPFRPQCTYPDCETLFSNFQTLADHEWRHYIPVPQRKEVDLGASTKNKPSEEAPWKQRVKIEEIWLQNKTAQRSPTPDKSKTEDQETSTTDHSQIVCEYTCPTTEVSHGPTDDKPAVNGFEDVTKGIPEVSSSTPHTAKSPKKRPQKSPSSWDVINVKEWQEMSTLAEGIQKNIAEPHITEHKTFKPEDPAYAPFVKTPFVRPPPSTYLNESLLSMRKRRSPDQPPLKQYTNTKKKKELAAEKGSGNKAGVPEKVRHRCSKCLSSFGTSEELQSHEARNTCSSLFGFDSDDES
ncbi:zinc finger protein 292 [Fundulus heteroclitus]|uniref:zinc finger protein 292 n=1 Tax=Fundulus heteroclitus TaxID=8078 RepID=UPI00165C9C3A|nr:zinc finger protein 292 [Fundulus heteroclitus]